MQVLETDRLDLRWLEAGDAPFILKLLNERAFLEFIGDKGVRNLADARGYIKEGPGASYAEHGFGLNCVTLKKGTAIGICGLLKRPALDDPDLGFAFLEDYWGRGYAYEAAKAALTKEGFVSL